MRNFYPEFPILPYEKTLVRMDDVIACIKWLQVDKEIKRAIYCVFRIESGNGTQGINNNYIGLQADSARWDTSYNKYITGVCIKEENRTGKQRAFLCFHNYTNSIDILADKLKARGLYVGGTTHLITHFEIKTPSDLALAYEREWVEGSANYKPTEEETKMFLSIYKSAEGIFQ
jgi:hypothetical protein